MLADEREKASAGDGRIRLNLGHTVGHGLEAALGYAGILHGEAVAYGLRAASRIGAAVGVTPPEQAARIEGLLSKLDLGSAPPQASLEAVLEAMEADKKHGAAGLRWVLPKAAGVEVRADVSEALVREVVGGVLAGTAARATVG